MAGEWERLKIESSRKEEVAEEAGYRMRNLGSGKRKVGGNKWRGMVISGWRDSRE